MEPLAALGEAEVEGREGLDEGRDGCDDLGGFDDFGRLGEGDLGRRYGFDGRLGIAIV